MLAKLAWRNIWRNKRRSMVVLLSIIVGVNAVLFTDGMSNGMLNQMLFNQISSRIAHIQIHKKGFNDNKSIQNYLPDQNRVENILNNDSEVKDYSKRIIAYGLLSSASNSSGIYIYGIDPETEKKVSDIYSNVIKGTYLTGKPGEILLGSKLAEKLGVGLGSKVVAMSNTPDGRIGSNVFRVVGLYRTPSPEYDKTFIYITLSDGQEMLEIGENIFELAIITNDYKQASAISENLQTLLGKDYEVLSYSELLPFIILQMDMYGQSMFLINLIIGLALIFGIVNSMLMAVFERVREFGVLMSIGMRSSKIFFMIIIEAFFLGILGTVIGLILGGIIHIPLYQTGIDFTVFAKSLESFGVGAVIYPVLSFDNLVITFLMIPFISVVGAIYPAVKAVRLQPVNAVRYV